ncbi:MAG: D-amino-acid transaminase, partial [Pseudomonadota bacterium]
MTEVAFVNNEFVSTQQAKVSVFDRGFLFADGVYEVTSVLDGKLVDNSGHMARLNRSLSELNMPWPLSPEEIVELQRQLVSRNHVHEGTVYLQITRGSAPRDFAYPKKPEPTLVMFSSSRPLVENPAAITGITVITTPDIRWARRDIKTVGLLAASMAKQSALDQGADDAWFEEDGVITEGTSNNAFIVDAQGNIITRQVGHKILAGITRSSVMALCQSEQYHLVERPFTVAEAHEASEAFVTSASTFVLPVVSIDGHRIGN